jgi:hypothetical protein
VSTATAEKSLLNSETHPVSKVPIRPGVEITDDLRSKIDDISVAYAHSEYGEMSEYTTNLTAHGQRLGLSYNQFVNELIVALRRRGAMPSASRVVRLLLST